ncbi:hypothetical protein CC2G_009453 [Coprinopsis cinerea AmutBmut pab1-1]|nr:hypothetical protein CC2G_009453 [Coprinopsis cinerea AmutBmut pab1-1]
MGLAKTARAMTGVESFQVRSRSIRETQRGTCFRIQTKPWHSSTLARSGTEFWMLWVVGPAVNSEECESEDSEGNTAGCSRVRTSTHALKVALSSAPDRLYHCITNEGAIGLSITIVHTVPSYASGFMMPRSNLLKHRTCLLAPTTSYPSHLRYENTLTL